MKKIFGLLFGAVLIIGIIVTRFYSLGLQPPGLHIDEVSFGMEAKSLSDTGRDTWGQKWPLYFKGFGEFKAPGLVYATIPFIKLNAGNISTAVTRMPSAVMGILALISIYLLIGVLWPSSSIFTKLLITSILAFSPWHFGSSRVYFETSGGSAWMMISLFLLLKGLLDKHEDKRKQYWLLGVSAIVIAGYRYSSFRYVSLLILGLSWIFFPIKWQEKKHLVISTLLVILIFGFGWVRELGSSKGLSRLTQFRDSTDNGSALISNEKREFCYLSFNKNPKYTKLCYLLWNKPVIRTNGIATFLVQYISAKYLFIESGGDYGVDGGYGSYLFPMIIPYIVGIGYIVWCLSQTIIYIFKRDKGKFYADQSVYGVIFLWLLVSFIPASFTQELIIHRSVLGLYIVMIVIIIGVREISKYLINLSPRFNKVFWFIFTLISSFYVIQSLTNYFLVFTHSNDMMWTSDTQEIYGYAVKHAGEYDRIVDSALHGPLAAAFYGGLTTEEILESGKHSPPDPNGWTYLVSAGKFELRHVNVIDLACEQIMQGDKRHTLVITEPIKEISDISEFSARSWNGVYILHEIYDLNKVMEFELRTNTSFKNRCKLN